MSDWIKRPDIIRMIESAFYNFLWDRGPATFELGSMATGKRVRVKFEYIEED